MDIIFQTVGSDGDAWVSDLQRAFPDARVRVWRPGDDKPADYALVWKPSPEVLRPRESLRAIFNLGAGVDAILSLARNQPGTVLRSVPIVRLEDTGMAAQMVEYSAYAVLRHMRRFGSYEAQQALGLWKPLKPYRPEDFAVAVLGLGQLGAKVARALAAFHLPVRGFSRRPTSIEGVTCFDGSEGLTRCLSGARAVINLLPDTPETRGILNRDAFGLMADDALVVNLARGTHLVDEDLLCALQAGKVGWAMLDVFQAEPLHEDHSFWRHPKITLTPHIGALTLRPEAVAQIVSKIEALERGESISGIVDIERSY